MLYVYVNDAINGLGAQLGLGNGAWDEHYSNNAGTADHPGDAGPQAMRPHRPVPGPCSEPAADRWLARRAPPGR